MSQAFIGVDVKTGQERLFVEATGAFGGNRGGVSAVTSPGVIGPLLDEHLYLICLLGTIII